MQNDKKVSAQELLEITKDTNEKVTGLVKNRGEMQNTAKASSIIFIGLMIISVLLTVFQLFSFTSELISAYLVDGSFELLLCFYTLFVIVQGFILRIKNGLRLTGIIFAVLPLMSYILLLII